MKCFRMGVCEKQAFIWNRKPQTLLRMVNKFLGVFFYGIPQEHQYGLKVSPKWLISCFSAEQNP